MKLKFSKKNTVCFLEGSRGITLVEMLIVLAIVAILFSTAMPAFTPYIQNNRLATQANELNAALSLARSEAIKRNSSVTVCQSNDSASCTGDWEEGWIVFHDVNFNGTVNSNEEIIRVHGGIQGGNTITFSEARVTYGSDGLARAGANETFTLCDARGAVSAKGIIIGPSGRPRLAMYTDDDEDSERIRQDSSGSDLECS